MHDLRARGLKTGVLTDVPYGMDRRFVERDLAPVAAHLDVALTSVEVGYRKPAPNGFLALDTELGVPPDLMLYVGNEPKDIQGANAADMVSVLLVREGERGDHGQKVTIHSLRELDILLGGTAIRGP